MFIFINMNKLKINQLQKLKNCNTLTKNEIIYRYKQKNA